MDFVGLCACSPRIYIDRYSLELIENFLRGKHVGVSRVRSNQNGKPAGESCGERG